MAENWNAVAAEVAVAIGDVGVPLTLRRPGTGGPATPFDPSPVPSPQDYTIYAVPDQERIRDASGTLIGRVRETLLVSAVGVVPDKADRVLVRGRWREIEEVRTLWQGGVDLLYDLVLVA